MIIPLEVINRLMEAGRMENMEPQEWSATFGDLKKHDDINRLHWQDWYNVVEDLNDEELVFTIKALTYCEERFKWSGGSVSAVIWTYRALANRGSNKSDEMSDWLLVNSDNPWVPFGSHRSKVPCLQTATSQVDTR